MSQQEKNTVDEKTSKFVSIIWNPVTRFLGSLPFGLTILILLTASMRVLRRSQSQTVDETQNRVYDYPLRRAGLAGRMCD